MTGNLFLEIDYGTVTPTDNGTRPYTGSQPLWNNSSLFLDPPPQTQATVNQPATIKVRVSNNSTAGTTVTGVRVRAYVMSPQVGLASPAQALQTFLSDVKDVAPGSGGGSSTDAHIFDCLSGGMPWVPTQAQLNQTPLGQGHLCLVANCYQDPLFASPPPPLEGHDLAASDTFDIANDQHQGQRNIMLAPAAPGAHFVGFEINAAPAGQEATIEVEKLVSAQVQGPSERFLLLTSPLITAQRTGSGRRKLYFTDADGADVAVRYSRYKLNYGLTLGEPKQIGKVSQARKLALDPAAQITPATLSLEISPKEPPGSIHAFDIIQRGAKGQVLGGLRVLSVVSG
jgi:hypothetical protein